MGTAQYLSPEQAQGHAVSETSDLYSIAVVLYEMLTGRVPFDADSAVSIALKHVSEAPPPPRHDQPERPAGARAGGAVGAEQESGRPAPGRGPVHHGARAGPGVDRLRRPRADDREHGGAERCRLRGARRSRHGLPAAAARIHGRRHPSCRSPASTRTRRRRRASGNAWPWIALLVALLLAGGGVAAYLLTRPTKVTVPNVVIEQLSTARIRIQDAGLASPDRTRRTTHRGRHRDRPERRSEARRWTRARRSR